MDLLSPAGRAMLLMLSVFADSFTLATAKAVGDGDATLGSASVEEASVVRALPNRR